MPNVAYDSETAPFEGNAFGSEEDAPASARPSVRLVARPGISPVLESSGDALDIVESTPPASGQRRQTIAPAGRARVPSASIDLELTNRLQRWAAELLASESTEGRAALLNQIPDFVSWATAYVPFARALEESGPLDDERRLAFVQQFAHDDHQRALARAFTNLDRVPLPLERDRPLRGKRGLLEKVRKLLGIGLASVLGSSKVPDSPELLVLSFQPNSTRSFLPVARLLRERGRSVVFLTYGEDDVSRTMLLREGFGSLVAERYLRFADVRHARLDARRLFAKIRRDRDGLREALGLPAWAGDVLDDSLFRGLERRLSLASMRARFLGRAVDRTNPAAALFVTNRGTVNELLRVRRSRLRSIFFLQGIVPDVPPVWTELDVDLAIIGSGVDLPYVRRCQVPEHAIRVTGYPDYDGFRALDEPTARRRLREHIGSEESARVVLFTSQYPTTAFPDWARERNLGALVGAARALPNVHFLVKPHPLRETLTPELLAHLPPNVTVLRGGSTPEWIRGADVVVTYWSTTALEALLLDTPLLHLNATGLPDFFDLSDRLGQSTLRSTEDLVAGLTGLFEDPGSRDEYRRRAASVRTELAIPEDDHSARRAAFAIEAALR